MATATCSVSTTGPLLRVSVKWNSKEYKDIDVDPSESLTLFKAQLFTLTGVPPERQKLMAGGKLLKDIEDLQRAARPSTMRATGGSRQLQKNEENGKNAFKCVKIILLGTAEGGELQQPQGKTVFIEDLTPAEQAHLLRQKNIEPLPSGITNLGNTCYLAAVLQMLRPCHELTTAIRTYIISNASTAALASGRSGASHRLGLAIKDFYVHWENSTQAAQPLLLVHAIREAFPQFARKGTPGPDSHSLYCRVRVVFCDCAADLSGEAYMQQDAEECLVCLLGVLGDMLPKSRTTAAIAALPTSYGKAQNYIEALFAFDTLLSSWRVQQGAENSTGAGTETGPVEKTLEKRMEFTCFLGTLQQPVNTLDEGLKFSLGEERIDLGPTKTGVTTTTTTTTNSTATDHHTGELSSSPDHLHTTLIRSSLFASLPFYLVVHFMRFEWKRSGTQTEKAKVCKSLKFSSTLDVYSFCTEELKEQLRIGRAVLALRRDREAGDGSASTDTTKTSDKKNDSNGKKDDSTNTSACHTQNNNSGDNTVTGNVSSVAESGNATRSSVPNGHDTVGKSVQKKQDNVSKDSCSIQIYPTGMFNLLGIVTHQGRHADSGHYVGWAKKDQREPRRIEREERERREAAEQARKLEAGGNAENYDLVRPQRRMKTDDTWLKFDDDKVSEMPWSHIDLAGGRSDYHIAYLLMFRQCLVEPTEEELETVERLRKEQDTHTGAEQKKRKATEDIKTPATAKKD